MPRTILLACLLLAAAPAPAPGSSATPVAPAGGDPITELLGLAASEASDARLRARLVELGTPLVAGSRVLFVVESPAGGPPPRVVGDWNDWGDGPEPSTTRQLGARPFFVLETSLRDDARVEYRIVDEAGEQPDPFASRRVRAFEGEHSELRMPGWRPYDAPPPAPLRGRLVELEHASAALGDRRMVTVYLPPGYDAGSREYPSAWIHDGALYVGELDVASGIDALVAAGRLEPLVAVFVPPVDRRTEYGRNPRYRRLVADELVPRLAAELRIEASADRRAVLGASRGALAALDLALERPDLFGRVGLLAPAVEPQPVASLFAERKALPGRFVVARAHFDRRFGPDAPAIVAEATRRGARVESLELVEGHTLETWRGRFVELVERLWAP
jgi:enterochelin esterase family protein